LRAEAEAKTAALIAENQDMRRKLGLPLVAEDNEAPAIAGDGGVDGGKGVAKTKPEGLNSNEESIL
jgi:hypothetical protein